MTYCLCGTELVSWIHLKPDDLLCPDCLYVYRENKRIKLRDLYDDRGVWMDVTVKFTPEELDELDKLYKDSFK